MLDARPQARTRSNRNALRTRLLGGEVVRHIGAWDLPLRPWIYGLYTQVWPRLIEVMRRGGEAQTREDLGL